MTEVERIKEALEELKHSYHDVLSRIIVQKCLDKIDEITKQEVQEDTADA